MGCPIGHPTVSRPGSVGRTVRMDVATRHDTEAHRYEISVDGTRIGIAEYRDFGDVLEFHHTVIDRDWRGQGMGARLVGAALADVQRSGRVVIPTCWYVEQYIREHPDAVSAPSAPSSTGE